MHVPSVAPIRRYKKRGRSLVLRPHVSSADTSAERWILPEKPHGRRLLARLNVHTPGDAAVAHMTAATPFDHEVALDVRDIDAASPADWDADRKAQYLDWAICVVDGCRGVNQTLDQLFDQVMIEARDRLNT